MDQSKLITVLRTFNAHEWKHFRAMINSSYHNRNRQVQTLCDWLADKIPANITPTRAQAQAVLFPKTGADEAQLNHTMSQLLKLAEQFLTLEYFQRDEQALNWYTLNALHERGLEKHYRAQFDKTEKQLTAQAGMNGRLFWEQYRLYNLEANRRALTEGRQYNELAQKAADNFDRLYLSEKLHFTCFMLTSQAIIATPYNLQLADEVIRFTGANLKQIDTPVIEAYFRIVQLLLHPKADADFEALKSLLYTKQHLIARDDLRDIFQYAINHCNLQIMQDRETYVAEALELYMRGIEHRILLSDGKLDPWNFKNIIKLALRLKRYEWTEQFILSSASLLAPEFREDAYHYNLGELYYYNARFEEAMQHINKVEFTDIHYNIGSKVILCKIYAETDADDALDSLLHAFNTFLRRNKLISDEVRRTYLNFVQALRQIKNAKTSELPAIRERIEQMRPLAEKTWLLRAIN